MARGRVLRGDAPSRGLAVGARHRGRDAARLRRRERRGRRPTHPTRPPDGRLDGLARATDRGSGTPSSPTPRGSGSRCGSATSAAQPTGWTSRIGVADELIAENVLSASADGRWLMDRVQKGDGGEWQTFIRRQDSDGAPGSDWWRVADIADNCPYAVLGADAVYLLSRRDAPHGRVLRLPLTEGATVADADEFVPASHLVIEDLVVTRQHGLGRRDGRRAPAAAGGRPRRPAAALAADPACEHGVVVLRRARQARSRPARPGHASRSPSHPRGGWRPTGRRPDGRPWRRPVRPT